MKFSKKNENLIACCCLAGFAIWGILLGFFIIPFCDEDYKGITLIMGIAALPFLIMGILFGILIFIFESYRESRIVAGIITGFTFGYGIMTIWALFSSCQ